MQQINGRAQQETKEQRAVRLIQENGTFGMAHTSKEISNISLEDATQIVRHFYDKDVKSMPVTHIKTIARNILHSKKISVTDAITIIKTDNQMWKVTAESKPPEKVLVETKIDDIAGVRNEQVGIFDGGRWWDKDHKMYWYYIPTHWRLIGDK